MNHVEKWKRYALVHKQYQAQYTGEIDEEIFFSDLYYRGWEEIKVCDNPQDLESLFTPKLTAMVRSFFRSEFAVIFRTILERDIDEIDETCFWHRDAAPAAHLRIIAPLVESDGGTAVISLDEMEGIDYDPPKLKDRLFNYTEFGAKGCWEVIPAVGEAIIFQPSRVLHKSIPPKTKPRKSFQCGLIPWNEPWQEFEEKYSEWVDRNDISTFPIYRVTRNE